MSRRILKLMALLFAIVLALSGCNLVQIDEEIDNAEVVATFNGGTVTKGEVMPSYESSKEYYDYLSSYYGYTFSTDGLLESVVDEIVQEKVLLAKAAELGLEQLSEEEEAAAVEEASDEYEETVQNYWSSFATDGLTDEEIRAEIDEYFAANDYTLEALEKDYREAAIIEKLQEYVYADVIVTPENLQDAYNEMVAEDEAAYAEDAYSYESATMDADETIAWNPEGYRTVKHILLTFTEEQQAALDEIDTEIADLQTMIADQEDAAEAQTEETEESGDEVQVLTADDLQKMIDEKTAEKEELLATYVVSMRARLDEIYSAIENGEDFDALIEEYNEDSGMNSEPVKTRGYYVSEASEMWVASFRDGAMALENIGDVSDPVVTDFGVHIIRYNSDVPAGAVSYDELAEQIEESVTEEMHTAAYEECVEIWLQEANIQIDLSSIEG